MHLKFKMSYSDTPAECSAQLISPDRKQMKILR